MAERSITGKPGRWIPGDSATRRLSRTPAANHVIHLDRWWNPAVEDQCTDRVYRIGQEKPVQVCLPIAQHPDPRLTEISFDLTLDRLMQRKRTRSRDLLNPPAMSDQDTDELFRNVCGELNAPNSDA